MTLRRRAWLKRGCGLPARGKRTAKSGGHLFVTGRDPTFLAFVRRLPCAACGTGGRTQTTRTQAAHVISRGAGGVDLGNAVPLCADHHHEQHTVGIKTFQRRTGLRLADLAMQIGLRYVPPPATAF